MEEIITCKYCKKTVEEVDIHYRNKKIHKICNEIVQKLFLKKLNEVFDIIDDYMSGPMWHNEILVCERQEDGWWALTSSSSLKNWVKRQCLADIRVKKRIVFDGRVKHFNQEKTESE